MTAAVRVDHLRKVHGETVAEGEIFGVLGPNGAGKTTTVECEVKGANLVRFTPSAPFEDRLLLDLPVVHSVEHHAASVEVTGSGDLVNAVILTLAAAGVTAARCRAGCLQPRRRLRRAHRPRGSTGMNGVRLSASVTLVRSEARLAWRSPCGLAFGVALPLVMLVLFGELPHFKEQPAGLGGLSRFDAEVPVLAAFVIAALALLVLAGPLTSYGERGILRRMSVTPMRPGWLLAAHGHGRVGRRFRPRRLAVLPLGVGRERRKTMSTVTVSRDVTSKEVVEALRDGLGPRYEVLPGMRMPRSPMFGRPKPSEPDLIMVAAGAMVRAQVTVIPRGGRTDLRITPGGLLGDLLMNTFGVAREVRRVLLTTR